MLGGWESWVVEKAGWLGKQSHVTRGLFTTKVDVRSPPLRPRRQVEYVESKGALNAKTE